MTTKSLHLTYWITTSAFCLMMAASGVLYLTSEGFKDRFAYRQSASYFKVELALCKFAGVVVLLPSISSVSQGVGVCRILHCSAVCVHRSPGEW